MTRDKYELEDAVRVWEQVRDAHSATYHDGGSDRACPICAMIEAGLNKSERDLEAFMGGVQNTNEELRICGKSYKD